MIFLLRGISGSGKSTLAKKLQDQLYGSNYPPTIVSADSYFMQDDTYNFDSTRLNVAHTVCQEKCRAGCCHGDDNHVIVDNSNTTWKEILPYLKIAKNSGVWAVELYPDTPWATNVEECFLRNTHGVPRETIQKMADRFEWNLQPKINNYLLGTL